MKQIKGDICRQKKDGEIYILRPFLISVGSIKDNKQELIASSAVEYDYALYWRYYPPV